MKAKKSVSSVLLKHDNESKRNVSASSALLKQKKSVSSVLLKHDNESKRNVSASSALLKQKKVSVQFC
jgi:hypothetical protein